MPPRGSKTKAAVAPTPRRATRSQVREGSVTLEEPKEIAPTPRKRNSRSKTPESKHSSFEKAQLEHLPALTEEEEKRQSPRIDLPQPHELAPILDASPYVTPIHYQHVAAASKRDSLYTSPSVRQSTEQSYQVQIHEDLDSDQDQDQDQDQEQEQDEQDEDEAVQAQLANETADAGSSHSHPTPPSLKRKSSSLAGSASVSAKKRSITRVGASYSHFFDASSPYSPLGPLSGNAVSSPVSPFPYEQYLNLTPSPKRQSVLSSPALLSMDRVLNSPALFDRLTLDQRTALLMDMRKEIMRLRKIEQEYNAGPQQSVSLAKSSPQPASPQEPSPEIPRTITRKRDLRYHMSIANPAKESYKAQLKAEAEAAAAAQKAEAEKAALQQQQLDSTPSRSAPSSAESRRKSKTPQSKTPDTQTPVKSPKTSAPAETPTASPSWGITSLFGSVRKIFTHRPNLSPVFKQPEEQEQDRQQGASTQPNHVNQSTPLRSKKQMRITSKQSPTPKARIPASPAPPETPTPVEDPTYGQTPRTERRTVRSRRLGTPAKPKETNADRRAEQLEQAAQKTVERKRIQEQADKIEQERRMFEDEQRKRDEQAAALAKTGEKRKATRLVDVDKLKVIPKSEKGQSGTYGMLDAFFSYDSDSDEVEMDEEDISLIETPEPPSKRARLDQNVFQPKTPVAQPPATSPVKQSAAPLAVPATPTPNYSQLAQQAIEKQRLQLTQYKPKKPSRLATEQRLSTGSSIAAPSPEQVIAAAPQDIQEVIPVPQLPKTPLQKVYQWPAGESMETPETWAKIDRLYTSEMKAADHDFFTRGMIAAMANSA